MKFPPQPAMRVIHKARVFRGLRFRLMFSYSAFFLALLIVAGIFVRGVLQKDLSDAAQALLNEEWDAAKGYVSIENFRPQWVPDPDDPEERRIVDGLKLRSLFLDAQGVYIEGKAIGTFSPTEVRTILSAKEPTFLQRRDTDGVPYLIKAGLMPDDKKRPYFFAMSQSLEGSERTVNAFTRQFFLFLPLMLIVSSALGWAVAARALRPLNEVAQAAQGLTGSSLTAQLKSRGADDELDHLIDSFNRMTVRLQQSFEQMRRFSTDVSHELRTPLTAIQGQLEVALFTAETPDQFRDAMANALEDVEKLSSIVRALLLLSQAESGQIVLQRAALDLGELAEDIADQFQIPAQEKRIELSVRVEAAPIEGDRTQIERLISNLTSNAIKYTPEFGRIQIRTRSDGTHAILEVQDSGVGIPAENLPHIFDRFYRVKGSDTNTIEGLGLGLSFVSWIASVHGGTIEVDSDVGKGTLFRVRLPLRDAPSDGSTPSQPHPQPANFAG